MEAIALQNLFYRAVWEKDSTSIEELSQHIKAAKDLTPAEGLAVYRGNIVGNLTQTLTSIYPVCCQLVGEKFFEATSAKFISQFPCFSPDLGDYGEEFPDFLTDFEPVANLPYLSDVARLEWFWHRVFIGEDTTGLDLKRLAEVPQERWGELIFYLPKNSVVVLLKRYLPWLLSWLISKMEIKAKQKKNKTSLS
ncbi:MAG: DUF2063 domain-containing protein [Symploca sp. SIO3E6]|nr:DUF2063 domain-containing protein [Caldora sp. SIO3E6]